MLGHLEQAAHLQVGVAADTQGAGRSGLLHACGNVDGKATDGALVAGATPATAEQHAAGVDAQAHAAAGMAVSCQDLGTDHPAQLQQAQPAAHRAFGIVFSGLF